MHTLPQTPATPLRLTERMCERVVKRPSTKLPRVGHDRLHCHCIMHVSACALLRVMCFMMLSRDGHSDIVGFHDRRVAWMILAHPGPRLGKDLQALSIRRYFHTPSSVKSSDALRNGAQPCSGVLLPMRNLHTNETVTSVTWEFPDCAEFYIEPF